MDNKNVFAANLKRLMQEKGKTRREVCEDLGFSYYTFSDWVNGKKYARMDKVEILAKYFGVLKSDLIEERTEDFWKAQKKNDTLADIVVRLRTDEKFLSSVTSLYNLAPEKLDKVEQLLQLL